MSEQDVQVRRASPRDLDALVPLFDAYRQFYGQASDAAAAREFLSARIEWDESTVFLAEAQAGAVGFIQIFPSFSSVALARTFVLNDLYVAPGARRHGVARALLGTAEAYCKEHGALRITLSTQTTNAAARQLYASLGWKQQTEYQVYTLSL